MSTGELFEIDLKIFFEQFEKENFSTEHDKAYFEEASGPFYEELLKQLIEKQTEYRDLKKMFIELFKSRKVN